MAQGVLELSVEKFKTSHVEKVIQKLRQIDITVEDFLY